MTASVDVVIPVYNGAAYIGECLDSILAQTLPPARIIVSDDGSTDATATIVKSYSTRDSRVEFLAHANGGVSSARNRGIRASTATHIAFIDADDVWMPDKLEKQMAVFSSGGPRLGGVHCAYEHMNADGSPRPQDVIFSPHKRGAIFTDLLFGSYVLSGSASAAVVRRDVLNDVGLFDERLFLGEDWDLWVRIAEKYDWDYAPETLIRIRVHNQSAQRCPDPDKGRKFLFQHLILYNRWYGQIPFPDSVLTRLRADVARIVLKRYFNPFVALRLYRQLHTSDLALARDLFPDLRSYSNSLFPLAVILVKDKLLRLARKILRR